MTLVKEGGGGKDEKETHRMNRQTVNTQLPQISYTLYDTDTCASIIFICNCQNNSFFGLVSPFLVTLCCLSWKNPIPDPLTSSSPLRAALAASPDPCH